jgi:hypothetical protein
MVPLARLLAAARLKTIVEISMAILTNTKRGGPRPGAGRPRGSVNRRTIDVANRALEAGITPLEVILQAMREHYDAAMKAKKPAERLAMLDAAVDHATRAAPYMHRRLANVDGVIRHELDITSWTDQELEVAEQLVRKATVARGDPGGEAETRH